MSVQIKSTKKFLNLPCGHAQFFDKNKDGTPGHCASVHGYDRSVEITFAGQPDEMGWIIAFGEATKPIKRFLEYYFDHVTVLPANDPRISEIPESMTQSGGVLGTLRVLPSGVSMEMSSAFVWEHVNAYVNKVTDGRCYVSRIQIFEHERNSGILEVDEQTALEQAKQYLKDHNVQNVNDMLPQKPRWELETPSDLIQRLNQ